MKQKDIIRASKAIRDYKAKENKEASLAFNYALFQVQKLIEKQIEFQTERETALYNEFKPEVKDNVMDFGSVEKKNEFVSKINELGNLDVDLGEFTKPTIQLSEKVSLSIDDIEALEPFVNFI